MHFFSFRSVSATKSYEFDVYTFELPFIFFVGLVFSDDVKEGSALRGRLGWRSWS